MRNKKKKHSRKYKHNKERCEKMQSDTGSFIDMGNLLQQQESLTSANRYFDAFLKEMGISAQPCTRANICKINGEICYFTGAGETYWWGFSKKVIQDQTVTRLIVRGTQDDGEAFYLVFDATNLGANEGRVIISARGSDGALAVSFNGATYKTATRTVQQTPAPCGIQSAGAGKINRCSVDNRVLAVQTVLTKQ